MKHLVILLGFMFCAGQMQAQYKINVQNNTKTEFYNDLETAISKAASGDTLYLPGAELFVSKTLVIDKKLFIIGAGCDADSTGGLRRTKISLNSSTYASFNFREGSSGSLITGCVFGNITFGHTDEFKDIYTDIENITFWRNAINDITLGFSSDKSSNKVRKIVIRENIIAQIDGANATDCLVNNNLINGYHLKYLTNAQIYNNVTNNYLNGMYGLNRCTVRNNYILGSLSTPMNDCVFENNAFVGNISFPFGTNTGSNNLMNQETIRTFQVNNIDLTKNIVIRDTSPLKTGGTDGTEIGIYGGPTPYKASVFNPHIDKAVISAQTDSDGKLKVNIQVSAQTR